MVATLPWLKGKYKSAVAGGLRQALQTNTPNREWTTGKHLREIDAALSGKHVKFLYDTLRREEAQVLAQLRTGHSKLRGFLARIGAVENEQCECGQGREDTRHFLFHCRQYQHLRSDMIKEAQSRYGDLSYMLGGRSAQCRPDGSNLDGPVEK